MIGNSSGYNWQHFWKTATVTLEMQRKFLFWITRWHFYFNGWTNFLFHLASEPVEPSIEGSHPLSLSGKSANTPTNSWNESVPFEESLYPVCTYSNMFYLWTGEHGGGGGAFVIGGDGDRRWHRVACPTRGRRARLFPRIDTALPRPEIGIKECHIDIEALIRLNQRFNYWIIIPQVKWREWDTV